MDRPEGEVEPATGFPGPFAPTKDDLSRCVHCGLCLQYCPTYTTLGLETESPRGRLYTIKAISEGLIEPTPNALGHLDLCLQCRNCESVCPSGVPFGRIMEGARAEILYSGHAPLGWRLRFVSPAPTRPSPSAAGRHILSPAPGPGQRPAIAAGEATTLRPTGRPGSHNPR